jgi:tetratricopeptide (TPR) repeat protein
MKTNTPQTSRTPSCMFLAALLLAALLPFLLVPFTVHAQSVRGWQGTITIPTYELGPPDPNPPFALVNPQPVYPYAMLDDLTDQRVPKTYRAIYLENQYLKITILPELGGHVYSVYDKLHSREMLYRNRVIKYGLVGPRGAWIAGGMEFSFPFAHTTDTVSAVESALHQNADGSATAIVGAVDWVSKMYWQIALTLRPDTARLEEGVTLFNATPLNHLYLFWTNTAVPATDDLQYIYPMRETISDDPFAIVQSWPVWEGVDQSWYKNDPSALAIFARDVHRDFFGAYYHQSNYGVVHVANFRQDPGKKLWSWGTARSGRIWDTILSDDDGPYNEIQSGRFPTQGYREFMEPHRVEQWTEYWYPVSGLDGGFVEATSQMALNVNFGGTGSGTSGPSASSGNVKLLLSPVVNIRNATVAVSLGTSPLRTMRNIQLSPLHPAVYTLPVPDLDRARKELRVKVQSAQGNVLEWSAAAPVDGNPDLVPSVGTPLQTPIAVTTATPIEQLYLQGVFLQKTGDTEGARKIYQQALQRDPGYVPALLQEAFYAYRAVDYATAERLIDLASQRENENPMVAYTVGLIYRAEGRLSLASNAFWTAIHYGPASVPGLSLSAAYLQLGEITIRQGEYAKAIDLLQQAVDGNSADALALTDLAVAQRLNGNAQAAAKSSATATQRMPLLPYALAENWLDTSGPKPAASHAWEQTIGSDPQNYLAIAAWYHDLGAWQSSDAVLHAAIANRPAQSLSPMIYYYLAANSRQQGDPQQAAQLAAKAASLPVAEVFPSSTTDAAVLTEAVHQTPQDAHAKYALGNFLFAHSRYEEAAALWSAALAQNFENPVLLRNLGVYQWHVKNDLVSAAKYYSRAIALSPKDYRLYTDLDEIYEEADNAPARAKLFRDAPADVLDRDTVRARHALSFIEQLQPDPALALFANHRFKPWEGGVVIHNMFVRANIQKGRQALAAHQPEQAAEDFKAAMEYPEDLGTGRPAQPELAEQFYWLGAALASQGKNVEATTAWETSAHGNGNDNVFSALAYRKLGQNDRAQQILQQAIEAARRPGATAHDFFTAGMASLSQGDKAHAQEYFHHALALDPLLWPARLVMSEMDSPGILQVLP